MSSFENIAGLTDKKSLRRNLIMKKSFRATLVQNFFHAGTPTPFFISYIVILKPLHLQLIENRNYRYIAYFILILHSLRDLIKSSSLITSVQDKIGTF